MKKAIISRYLIVLGIALLLCGSVFYLVTSRHIQKTTVESMYPLLDTVDYSLDYDNDLEVQVTELRASALDADSRITVLYRNGTVCADTDASPDALENHLEREEIAEALNAGTGHATRYSSTLHKNMLYVAKISSNGQYILRIAIPFSGPSQYRHVLFPILGIAFLISFVISSLVAVGFSDSITKPLNQIAGEMSQVQLTRPEFHFPVFQYEELNVIAKTTNQMADNIHAYLNKIEFERMIRQEFFSNASHELKTPITSIRGYSDLLMNDMIPTEEAKKDALQRIIKEADHMTELINDILMISRLETKETEVEISAVKMSYLLEDVIKTLVPLAAEYNVTLRPEYDKDLVIHANPQQMREMITNLLTNSIKYNRPGGLVKIALYRSLDQLIFSVEDTGVGISREDIPRVFERFYRVDKGRSRKMGGTGLGLSIVKHIVQFYDGTIQLTSTPGEGSRFKVQIPLSSVSAPDSSRESHPS